MQEEQDIGEEQAEQTPRQQLLLLGTNGDKQVGLVSEVEAPVDVSTQKYLFVFWLYPQDFVEHPQL
jgi:hypothetical protein